VATHAFQRPARAHSALWQAAALLASESAEAPLIAPKRMSGGGADVRTMDVMDAIAGAGALGFHGAQRQAKSTRSKHDYDNVRFDHSRT
jgi:hypothetical protein